MTNDSYLNQYYHAKSAPSQVSLEPMAGKDNRSQLPHNKHKQFSENKPVSKKSRFLGSWLKWQPTARLNTPIGESSTTTSLPPTALSDISAMAPPIASTQEKFDTIEQLLEHMVVCFAQAVDNLLVESIIEGTGKNTPFGSFQSRSGQCKTIQTEIKMYDDQFGVSFVDMKFKKNYWGELKIRSKSLDGYEVLEHPKPKRLALDTVKFDRSSYGPLPKKLTPEHSSMNFYEDSQFHQQIQCQNLLEDDILELLGEKQYETSMKD